MRNFTSQIDKSCTYVLDETVKFTDPDFVRIQESLVITMGANPEMMTPSEEGVLADFIGWVYYNLGANNYRTWVESQGKKLEDSSTRTKPIFVYHNLNEGHSVAVIWTDAEGKLQV